MPLTLVMADKGYQVFGVEKDEEKVSLLNKKKLPFREEGMEALFKKHFGERFQVSPSPEVVQEAEGTIICVGTGVDKEGKPDISQVLAAVSAIISHLGRGSLLAVRSTLPPNGLQKVKSLLSEQGRAVGKDLYLVYAPERIAEGFAIRELQKQPQLIGYLDEESRAVAERFFKPFSSKLLFSDALDIELGKLFLNTFRYAHFAIANELALIAYHFGADIHHILELVNQDYERPIPGPGFAGGPCLAKDSQMLLFGHNRKTIVSGAHRVNYHLLPTFLVEEINQRKPLAGKKVAVLGMTFKRNVDDERDSLSHQLVKLLEKEGAKVHTHDPYTKPYPLKEVLRDAEVVFLATNHDHYRDLGLAGIKEYLPQSCLICDLWNVLGTKKILFDLKEV